MISPDTRSLILESTRAGVPLDGPRGSARAARTTPEAVRAAMGDPSEEGRAFARAMADASEEGARAMVAAAQPVSEAPRVTWASGETQLARVESDPGQGDRWAQIQAEAARYAPGPLGFFLWIDARCVAHGMPSCSAWWRYSIGAFYDSGKSFGIFLVGRGGGKSTTLERIAGADSLFTERKVTNGQTHTWPFISVGPDDANRRISGIAAVYRAAGLAIIGEENTEGSKHKEGVKVTRAPRGALELLDMRGNAIQLASIAGTIGNVSGPSTIGMTIDEAAKLHDKTTNANPLTEIIASGAQTSRARRGWRAIVSSSAWETSGAHYQLIEQGDNESNFIARIGEPFLAEAVAGFESVAAWEAAGGQGRAPNSSAAERIRAHARSLTAASPMIPTWLANPTLGHPDALPWDGAALASRKLVQALPEGALGGIPREAFWLRENGSVPLATGGASKGARWTAEDWAAHREAMRGMGPARIGETDFAALHFDPFGGGETRAPGRYRGL